MNPCRYCPRRTSERFGSESSGEFDYVCGWCQLRIIREKGGTDAGLTWIMDDIAPHRDRKGRTIARIRL